MVRHRDLLDQHPRNGIGGVAGLLEQSLEINVVSLWRDLLAKDGRRGGGKIGGAIIHTDDQPVETA
ncbi:MAG: hypothetical protein DCC67_20165 [Planctomycetota bacterium]|nr:MAG: hypothetical protein DCC67_20165 [Planctomycetota bacterium]